MKARRLPARSALEQLLHQVPQRRPRLLLLPPALLNRLRLLHQLLLQQRKQILLLLLPLKQRRLLLLLLLLRQLNQLPQKLQKQLRSLLQKRRSLRNLASKAEAPSTQKSTTESAPVAAPASTKPVEPAKSTEPQKAKPTKPTKQAAKPASHEAASKPFANKELVSDSNKLVGVEVYSRTGNTLGTVTAFDFDPVFGAIKSITLDNGSEFKSDAFLFFAPDFVFVDDGSKSAADLRQAEDNTSDAPAAAPASAPATQPAPAAQPAAPAANADGLSNEDALLVDFLIGKTLNDDVANADDTFALPKGTEITREIALDAKKHDALLLLTMSVD